MIAYELVAKVTSDGQLDIPSVFAERLPRGQVVRLLVLIDESADDKDAAWSRLTAEQFLAGYSETDSIYDTLG